MARRSRSNNQRMRQTKRVASVNAPDLSGFSRPSLPRSVRRILSVEDRRLFSPVHRWPCLSSSRPARLVVSQPARRRGRAAPPPIASWCGIFTSIKR